MAVPVAKEAASLSRAVYSHAQSTLDDGRILVSGGDGDRYNSRVSPRDEVYLYNPTNNSWCMATRMSQPRMYHAQTTVGGLALVCGGITGKVRHSADAQVYDPKSDRWTAVAPMKTPRRSHSSSTLSDGRALVCGGQTEGDQAIAEVEIYDPRSNSWTQVASMPVPMYRHTQSTLTDGRVLVCGQDAKKGPTMCTYNPKTGRWTSAALPKRMVGTQYASQTTLTDGRVLVVGGNVDSKGVSTSALYCPVNNNWIRRRILPSALVRHGASLLRDSNTILVSGGTSDTNDQSRVYLINFDTMEPSVAPATPPHPGRSVLRASSSPATTDSATERASPSMVSVLRSWVTGPPRPSHTPPRQSGGADAAVQANGRDIAHQTEEIRRLNAAREAAEKEVAQLRQALTKTKDELMTARADAEVSLTRASQARLRMREMEMEMERDKEALEKRAAEAESARTEAEAREASRSAARLIAANADAAEATGTEAVEALRAHVAANPRLSLDMFQISARIGERSRPTELLRFYGVNSSVFEAVLDGRVVVIKVVYNVEQVTDSNLSKTFKTDYAVIEDASKNHPNILAGLGHFVGEASRKTLGEAWDASPEFVRLNTLFIVMEPMEQPLKKLISDLVAATGKGRSAWPPVLSLPVFKVVMQRLLRGLVKLFRLGIVHRDLKADNVLINYKSASDQEGRSFPSVLVKLADFGHALDTTKEDSIENFKMPYLVQGPKGGAPAYLAPEVAAAEPGTFQNPVFIDYSKNDVFAAGMLAHYVLTNGVEDAFAAHQPHYSAGTYNHLPQSCPQTVADLVWAMVNPSFEHRITAEEALARVDAMIDDSHEWA